MGRLIDAETLKQELYQQWFMDILLTQKRSDDMFYALAQKIDAQPIAYDPDKVVEQLYGLKKYGNKYDSYWDSSLYHMTEIENKTINDAVEKAIEIVKGGGVDVN